MSDGSLISNRKDEHIRINLEQDVQSGISNGLERYALRHSALPEINLEDVSVQTSFWKKTLSAPILISSMTGGSRRAAELNRAFAQAANATGVALGVGSQRAALEDPALSDTFNIRRYAPDVLLFANLGAVQLNYGLEVDDCRRAVDMIGADALILHLNPLQEALQPEGNTRFGGLLAKIAAVCAQISVPVIVKEVGWGIDAETARRLVEAGVSAIDVAGAGGTSWSKVEKYRHKDPRLTALAEEFDTWGNPTALCLKEIHDSGLRVPLIASGGLSSGVDLAKCLALGASLGGFARPFLYSANKGVEELIDHILTIKRTLEICLFSCGHSNLSEWDFSVLRELQG